MAHPRALRFLLCLALLCAPLVPSARQARSQEPQPPQSASPRSPEQQAASPAQEQRSAPPAQEAQDAPPPSPAQAQRPRRVLPPEMQGEPDEILEIDTDLIMLDVTVTDIAGRTVRGLRAEDFKIYEDGVERPLSFFNAERRGGVVRPVAIVFAVDISGSLTPEEMARLRQAMQVFSAWMAARPSLYAVMSFGMNVRVIQRFTDDQRRLDRAFERIAREPNGLSTHTYDAVDDAIRLLVRHAPRTRERRLMRRAVVVFTDGFPVGDTVAPQTVIERANAADVSVYTVTLPSYARLALASRAHAPLPTPLDVSGLVERTGGKNIYATESDFTPLFRALTEEVTASYVLAFYPLEQNRRSGRFHQIRVEAPRGLYVRQSRPGYHSTR